MTEPESLSRVEQPTAPDFRAIEIDRAEWDEYQTLKARLRVAEEARNKMQRVVEAARSYWRVSHYHGTKAGAQAADELQNALAALGSVGVGEEG